MLGVPVRTIDQRENVGLLSSCREARAGPDPRDIENHDWDFGVVGQADELVHQGDAGTCRRRHGTRTGPSCANGHADSRQFVFGLNDRVGGLAVLLVAIVGHVSGQRLAETRRGRNRIPGGNRDAREHAAQSAGGIPVDDDLAFRRIHPTATERNGSCAQILFRVLAADVERLLVQGDCLGLALELLVQGQLHLPRIDIHQLADNTDIDHVGEQLAQSRVGRDGNSEFCEGNRIEVKIFPQLIQIQRFFIDDHSAWFHGHHVIACGVGIHGYEEIDFFTAGDPSVLVGADRKPGRKAGDVRRKQVLSANGYSHLKDGAHEHAV